MDEMIIPLLGLAAIFFVVALLYSSVGLGGASSYVPLLALAGVYYEWIPSTALMLNIAVTLIGSINYWKQGHLRMKLIGVFLLSSMPMSYLGGAIALDKEVFYLLLWVTLVFVAIRIYWKGELRLEFKLHPKSQLFVSLLLGAILGFVSGTVGIGGGIYLVPLIILFGLGTEQEAAASGAAFILLNSMAGLVARFQRGAVSLELMLPLLLAVLAGGFLGSRLGAMRFNPLTIQKILGLVVILALLLLSRNIWFS